MLSGYLYLFSAVFLTGAWFIFLRLASEGTSPIVVQAIHVGGTVLGVFLLFGPMLWLMHQRGERLGLGNQWRYAIIAGLVICLANTFMFKAYEAHLPLGIVAVLLNLACVFPLIYGFYFLHERFHPLQVLGVILALAAAILISYPYAKAGTARDKTNSIGATDQSVLPDDRGIR